MTTQEFDDYRTSVLWYYSDICHKMNKQLQVGTDYKSLYYKLLVLKGYIQILLEYTLFTETEEDTNFFDVDEMILLNKKLNILLNTNYTPTFIKTV